MKAIKSILIFLAVFTVSFIVLELYLQTAEIQTPMETQIDAEIGPTFIPSKKVTRFNEGFYVGGTNEYGYLGPARPHRKTGDEKRILLLGDSYVMGMTLFNRHHFARYVERGLHESTGHDVQTLNFGKSDFNFSNMYQYYKDFASQFDFDLALFFVDQTDLIPSKQFDKDLYPTCYMDNNIVKVDYSFRNSQKFKAFNRMKLITANSAFFRLIYNARKMIARRELGEVVLDKLATLLPEKPKNRTRKPATKIPDWTYPILCELAKDSRSVLVTIVDMNPEIREIIQASGIKTIDIVSALNQLREVDIDPCYWPISGKRGHWNQQAHEAIGNLLANELIYDFIDEPMPIPKS